MDDRHERVFELFSRARRLPTQERRPFLEDACADDDVLREEVESLLLEDDSD